MNSIPVYWHHAQKKKIVTRINLDQNDYKRNTNYGLIVYGYRYVST